MNNSIRNVMHIQFQFKQATGLDEIFLWDIDAEQWLKEHAYQCSILHVEPAEWEQITDFQSGMVISVIKGKSNNYE